MQTSRKHATVWIILVSAAVATLSIALYQLYIRPWSTTGLVIVSIALVWYVSTDEGMILHDRGEFEILFWGVLATFLSLILLAVPDSPVLALVSALRLQLADAAAIAAATHVTFTESPIPGYLQVLLILLITWQTLRYVRNSHATEMATSPKVLMRQVSSHLLVSSPIERVITVKEMVFQIKQCVQDLDHEFLPSLLSRLVRYSKDLYAEAKIVSVFRQAGGDSQNEPKCTLAEYSYLVLKCDLPLVVYKVKDHPVAANRAHIIRMLCYEHIHLLDAPAKAMVIHALQKLKLSSQREFLEGCVLSLLTSIKGPDLTRFKALMDAKGDYHSLHKLVYLDVRSGTIRRLILEHILAECLACCPRPLNIGPFAIGRPIGFAERAKMRGLRASAEGRTSRDGMVVDRLSTSGLSTSGLLSGSDHIPVSIRSDQPVKVVCDIDDTFESSGGIFPAGVDKRLSRGTRYPGVTAFIAEVTKSSLSIGSGDISSLSAMAKEQERMSAQERLSAQEKLGAVSSSRVSRTSSSVPGVSAGPELFEDALSDGSPANSRGRGGDAGDSSLGLGRFSGAGGSIFHQPTSDMVSGLPGTQGGFNGTQGGFTGTHGNFAGTSSTFFPLPHAPPNPLAVAESSLVFLSARPHVYKDLSESRSYSKFSALFEAGRLHCMPTLLPGSLATGSEFLLRGRLDALASNKFTNLQQYSSLYPEYDFVFVGDNGQADALVAAMALVRMPKICIKAVFIHNVLPGLGPAKDQAMSVLRQASSGTQIGPATAGASASLTGASTNLAGSDSPTSTTQLSLSKEHLTWLADKFVFFTDYVDAAVHAMRKGLINSDALARVARVAAVECATLDPIKNAQYLSLIDGSLKLVSASLARMDNLNSAFAYSIPRGAYRAQQVSGAAQLKQGSHIHFFSKSATPVTSCAVKGFNRETGSYTLLPATFDSTYVFPTITSVVPGSGIKGAKLMARTSNSSTHSAVESIASTPRTTMSS